jgi:hypothetical protein
VSNGHGGGIQAGAPSLNRPSLWRTGSSTAYQEVAGLINPASWIALDPASPPAYASVPRWFGSNRGSNTHQLSKICLALRTIRNALTPICQIGSPRFLAKWKGESAIGVAWRMEIPQHNSSASRSDCLTTHLASNGAIYLRTAGISWSEKNGNLKKPKVAGFPTPAAPAKGRGAACRCSNTVPRPHHDLSRPARRPKRQFLFTNVCQAWFDAGNDPVPHDFVASTVGDLARIFSSRFS